MVTCSTTIQFQETLHLHYKSNSMCFVSAPIPLTDPHHLQIPLLIVHVHILHVVWFKSLSGTVELEDTVFSQLNFLIKCISVTDMTEGTKAEFAGDFSPLCFCEHVHVKL